MPEPTDGEVVRISHDDPRAFAVLFERHFAALHRYLRRRVPAGTADDLVAETFVRAFQGRARYDLDRPDARPWLYGIATNLVRQHVRREARELRAFARTAVDPVQTGAAVDPAGAELAAALAQLNDGERDVLFLYAWEDLGYDEIADALDTPIGTVRSRLSRARAKLRELLEPDRRNDSEMDERTTELMDG